MKKNKIFDCVEMKNKIQGKLLEHYNGLTPEEIRRKRLKRLESSENIIASKWRRLSQTRKEKSPSH